MQVKMKNKRFNYTNKHHGLSRIKVYTVKVLLILTAIILIIPQAGCQKKKDPTPLWDEGFYLDTICRITLYATDDELKMSVAKPILNDAFDIIRRYETILSKTKEGSDIWRINNAEGQPIACDAATVELLNKALSYCEESNGEFDITIGGVMDLWDFHDVTGTAKVPSSAELSRKLRHVDYKSVLIEGNTVTLLDPDAQLDLGGIAKGFIADKVAQYLRSRGVTGAVIDLGGNIEVVGYKAGWVPLASEVQELGDVDGDGTEDEEGGIAGGTPFVVGVKKPYTETNEIIGTLTVANKSIVTSGVYERFFESNGKKYHHILSSKTGYPVNNDLISVTVIGPVNTSADCDALATICMLKGLEGAKELIAAHEGYGAIFIDSEGEITSVGKMPELKLLTDEDTESDLTEEGIKVD